jgi:hypothetical protein
VNKSASAPARGEHESARDGGVVRGLVGADHAEGDILLTAALDHPRGALADGVGVEQQCDHHLRVKRRPTPAVGAIGAVDPAQVDLLDRVQDTPRQAILAQPVTQTRRQQQFLVSITCKEVLQHHRPPKLGDTVIVLTPPDGKTQEQTRFTRQPHTGLFDVRTRSVSPLDLLYVLLPLATSYNFPYIIETDLSPVLVESVICPCSRVRRGRVPAGWRPRLRASRRR